MARTDVGGVACMLSGEWLSRRLGYVAVDPPATDGEDSSEAELVVHKTGCGSVPRVTVLQLAAGGLRAALRCGEGLGEDLHIRGAACSKHRVVWGKDGDDVSEVDVWDRLLLREIKRAALWAERNSLRSDIDRGLEALSSGEATESPFTVGLCITMKNRLWQVQRALPLNILHCWLHRRWVTIHLVDCDGDDGALSWAVHNCRAAVDAGLLKIYRTNGRMPHWHASVAKNTSHAVATEDIVVNVDCDNIVGLDFPVDVADRMTRGRFSLLQYEDGDGTCGRIACWRRQFLHIGGYDEDAFPMGAQDVDLVERLKMLPGSSYQRVSHGPHGQAIPNDKAAKIANCDPALLGNTAGSAKAMAKCWNAMNDKNRQIFAERRKAGLIARNVGNPRIGLPVQRVL